MLKKYLFSALILLAFLITGLHNLVPHHHHEAEHEFSHNHHEHEEEHEHNNPTHNHDDDSLLEVALSYLHHTGDGLSILLKNEASDHQQSLKLFKIVDHLSVFQVIFQEPQLNKPPCLVVHLPDFTIFSTSGLRAPPVRLV